MNAIAKVLTPSRILIDRTIISLVLQKSRLIVLCVAILFTALSIVYIKDLNRRLFIDYQTLQQTNNQLHTDYGKLLLEESTWTSQGRVEQAAGHEFAMSIPTAQKIIIVKL